MESEAVKSKSNEDVGESSTSASSPQQIQADDQSIPEAAAAVELITSPQHITADQSIPEAAVVELTSPPVQTMEQPPGYDPNRIPASVFASNASNPGDWSGASNESLFSIQMGNNSFSKDYAFLFGKSADFDSNNPHSNPFRSGDQLPRLDEWKKTNDTSSSLPPVMEDSGEFCRSPLNGASKTPLSPSAISHSYPSPSRFSDVSNSSFAFPVLASDSGKNDYSVRVVPEKFEPRPQKTPETPQQPEPQQPPPPQAQAQPPPAHALKAVSGTRSWFSCFSCSCCPRCC